MNVLRSRAPFLCLSATALTLALFAPSMPAQAAQKITAEGWAVNSAANSATTQSKPADKSVNKYGALPLSFELNQGQSDAEVRFLSHTSNYSLFLTGDGAVLSLREETSDRSSLSKQAPNVGSPSVLSMKLRGANPSAKVGGEEELTGKSNFFIGNDPTKWRTNVPTYSKVRYESVYPGIDLLFYGNQRQLEYDFVVAPGANPRNIAFAISGAKKISQNAKGDLVFRAGDSEVQWHKPFVYQEQDGKRHEILASYSVNGNNLVGFRLAKYDASKPLYIDPLIYSTYLGGSGEDYGRGIALDSAGNAYVTGYTSSTNFPTKNPFQAANGGAGTGWENVFVTKINAAGTALVYSTYLGGNGGDRGFGIAVDSAGNAYVTGLTGSADFPTKNGLQTSYGGGGDAFVAKINAAGSALIYSTFLGGSANDAGAAIALDTSRNAYVTGVTQSANFPTTPGSFQTTCGCWDVFVSKINSSGSALSYSTFLGGSGMQQPGGIAVDHLGNAYVTGSTNSTDFPTKNALQTANAGDWDAFVTKFNPSGTALIYSTYLGGPQRDDGNAIAADSAGNAYVTGDKYTDVCNFNTCIYYGYLYKYNSDGSAILYSQQTFPTYSTGNGIAVDSSSNAFLVGTVGGDNPNPLHRAFVERFNASGSPVGTITYLNGGGDTYGYGIATDGKKNAYVTGATGSVKFPTKNPLQSANAGGFDAFVSKIDLREMTTTTLSASPNPSAYGQAVTFTATVSSSSGAPPNGETVSFMKGKTVLGTGTLSGGTASFTTSTLPVATNSITAVYAGDSNLGTSTSNVVKQVVDKATTKTAVTSSVNPSTFGQSVTFTATITPQYSAKVTGNVTFYSGTTALKTVAVSSDAAKFTMSTLASGSHNITATYNGSADFNGSSASLTQQVH